MEGEGLPCGCHPRGTYMKGILSYLMCSHTHYIHLKKTHTHTHCEHIKTYSHSPKKIAVTLTFPRVVLSRSCQSLHMCTHMSAHRCTFPVRFALCATSQLFFFSWVFSVNCEYKPLFYTLINHTFFSVMQSDLKQNHPTNKRNLVLLRQLMQKHKSSNTVWWGLFYVCLSGSACAVLANYFRDRGGAACFSCCHFSKWKPRACSSAGRVSWGFPQDPNTFSVTQTNYTHNRRWICSNMFSVLSAALVDDECIDSTSASATAYICRLPL